MAKRIDEQIGTTAPVEPERHFLKVGWQMPCRDPMPRTKDAALQERESRFNLVRGNFALLLCTPPNNRQRQR